MSETTEDLLRRLAPQVLGTLVRRHGQFEACEDAVQEALLAASVQWPEEGVPSRPAGWLVTVAGRRLTDHWRSEAARRERELAAAGPEAVPEDDPARHVDDTLRLLFLCCHPKLSAPSQVALTLRAVGGLTTAQIARAFLVPEATMAQRISRAKQTIKGAGFPDGAERLPVVLQVLYLIFNEGHTATSGPDLQRADLAAEAIRLAREVHRLAPEEGEAAGLLALMLLTDARRAARSADGLLVPLAEQDRSLWDRARIEEGVRLVTGALPNGPAGPYLLQAAIAAVHDEAPSTEETDWAEVLILYKILDRIAPNPMVTLNRAVATAMVHGPAEGLALLATLDGDKRIAGHYRLDAVRGHLLDLSGEHDRARDHYRRAARLTLSLPEREYLSSLTRER
ncbi:sigma-70 family RNA polymerase sigma factor [Streptomyces morookaense]|uniref:RNA polymerase sigma factor n=1 Tax=Streptomyces morookaense TaxID=1970 RepID=UPI0033EE5AF7